MGLARSLTQQRPGRSVHSAGRLWSLTTEPPTDLPERINVQDLSAGLQRAEAASTQTALQLQRRERSVGDHHPPPRQSCRAGAVLLRVQFQCDVGAGYLPACGPVQSPEAPGGQQTGSLDGPRVTGHLDTGRTASGVNVDGTPDVESAAHGCPTETCEGSVIVIWYVVAYWIGRAVHWSLRCVVQLFTGVSVHPKTQRRSDHPLDLRKST